MPGHAAILHAAENAPDLDVLATEILDDALYNILHDLVMKTHRDEKMARAVTAAIRVEKQAADATDGSLEMHPEVRAETDAAVYEEGRVTLKSNPLKTIRDVVCPKCHLPRLHYPVDGKGAQKPDPSVIYCKRMPFIDKPNHDIYGQTWVPLGPGRGKKKKDMEKRIDIPADQKPANLLSYPSATCSKCKRCILVTRLNNHMGSCIGNSGRVAGRAAAQKISSATASGANSQHEPTPPLSRRGTPVPPPATAAGAAAGAAATEATRKRDLAEMNTAADKDSDTHADSDTVPDAGPKKKKMNRTAVPAPKIKIKAKSMTPVPIPTTGAGSTSTSLSAAAAAAAAAGNGNGTSKKDKDRDEKPRRTVSESPIMPPKALSPSKASTAMSIKKQKTKAAPSPLKKMTKVKPPAPPAAGGAGTGGKKARVMDKAGLASSPAR